MFFTNQLQNEKLTLKNRYDSLIVNDSLIIQKNNALMKTLGTLEQKLTSYEIKFSALENQLSGNNTLNIVSNVVLGALLIWILLILLLRKRRKIKEIKKEMYIDRNSSPSKESVEQIFEMLKKLEDKINQQAEILNDLRNGINHIDRSKINDEEMNTSVEPNENSLIKEEQPPGRYLRLDSDSYYKEIFESDKATSFYESKYDEKNKVSEVSITKNITVKSSAAKSRLTPLFEVEGDYGNAVLKKTAKITWQGNKGQLLERGKIKLIE